MLEICSLKAMVDELQNAGSGEGLALPEAHAVRVDLRPRRHVVTVDLGLPILSDTLDFACFHLFSFDFW